MNTDERRLRSWISASVSPEIVMHVARTERGICRASLACDEPEFEREMGNARRDTNDRILSDAIEQLRAYFRGKLRAFSLPLDLEGTDFQRRVWNALLEIPYGERRTYADIAGRSERRRRFQPWARRTDEIPRRLSCRVTASSRPEAVSADIPAACITSACCWPSSAATTPWRLSSEIRRAKAGTQ